MVKRFVPAIGAALVLALVVLTRPLGAIARGIAIGCIVLSCVTAITFRSGDGRARASVALAIAAVLAAGQIDAGVVYGVAVAGFLLTCVAWMHRARRRPSGDRARSPVRTYVVLAIVVAFVAASLVVGLPRVAASVERRVSAMFGVDGDEATAFSTSMVLGSTRGMLQSDAIVMRIEGEHPEYLRGAVYDRYRPPFWSSPTKGLTNLPASAPAGADTTRIRLARGAASGIDMRWFLPAGACDLGVASDHVQVDVFGVARRAPGSDPPELTFRTTGCTSAPASVAEPTATDLEVVPSVAAALTPIATRWTASASSDREKLSAIQRELSRLEYSLAVPRESGVDPIVDFVTIHRAGHCEMFASAMALMARTQGIPARVVGGYRVSEENPLTGHAVVRDRNAHAWVEAWIEGAWRGFDPTPESESLRPKAKTLDHVLDAISMGIDRVRAAASRLGPLGAIGVLAGLVSLLLGGRWIAKRLRGRQRDDRDEDRLDAPLPCFEVLTHALAGAGYERESSEPLEVFARRLIAIDEPWATDAGRAILGYARLRYGDATDEDAIVGDVERSARAISTERPSKATAT